MNEDGNNSSLKDNLMSESIWIRIIYMVLFWLAGHIVIALVLLTAVVQGVLSLLSGQPNLDLQAFSLGLNRYLYQVASFLTFNSEAKPFPFSDWPATGHEEVTDKKGS